MNTLIFPEETRGRPATYDFKDMQVKEVRKFGGTTTANVLFCATSWVKRKGLKMKFTARKEDNFVYLMRIK